jgi:diguanylate cyclase (GGDEF)-like protein
MLGTRRPLFWVIVSVAATLLPLSIMSQFPSLEIPPPYWIASVIIPASISYFVSRKLLQQSEILARLNKELVEAHAMLSRVAETDHLTQLLNRGGFMRHVELSRTSQAGGLIVLDVDHFKSINDKFGHEAGDHALQSVAHALRKALRPTDIIGRLGGEEFGIYLPEATPQSTSAFAERVRRQVEETAVPGFSREQIALTASIGVTWVDPQFDLVDCLRKADLAMYRAKENGRNGISIAA